MQFTVKLFAGVTQPPEEILNTRTCCFISFVLFTIMNLYYKVSAQNVLKFEFTAVLDTLFGDKVY